MPTPPTLLERPDKPRSRAAEPNGRLDPTVDPRVAATGGRRRTFGDPKSNYEWPGMVAQADWCKLPVHQLSSYYCARCGKQFGTPHAVYGHLAKVHGR